MNKKDILKNLILVIFSFSIPMVVIEIILKKVNIPNNSSRVMLLGGGPLETNNDYKIRIYKPNNSQRQIGIYGKIIAYDYLFKTDQNGFRSTSECKNNDNKTKLAITGDSWTEGIGSTYVWIKQTQDYLCSNDIKTINQAIAGYGIQDMEKTLHYAKNYLDATYAIVSIISNDISRNYVEVRSDELCSTYYLSRKSLLPSSNKNPLGCGKYATWWHIPINSSQSSALSYSKSIYPAGLISILKNTKKLLIRKYSSFREIKKSSQINNQYLVNESIKSITRILDLYAKENVLIVILPTRADRNIITDSSKYTTIFNKNITAFIKSIPKDVAISDLRSCELTRNHFIYLDGHPNEDGHKLIADCAQSDKIFNGFIEKVIQTDNDLR